MAQVLQTEPAVPLADKPVTLYYNPSSTSLNGRPELFVRGGFNRWGDARKFGPLKLQSSDRPGFFAVEACYARCRGGAMT